MTDLKQAAKAVVDRWDSPKWEWSQQGPTAKWSQQGPTANLMAALRTALAQPEQEPTCPECKAAVLYECVACSSNNYPSKPEQEQEPSQWRDMVVVSLVREGINKHRARELADHFATPPAAQRPWQGLTDEDRRKFAAAQYGWEDLLIAAEAKLKERNRGATTHCQCAACKNGNIHDSDCSVHNGDALPVGPCDCSLATPPVYQPAANEAVEILKSLGYVYEPTYTGLAWVAKKSAQPEQEPVAYDKTELNRFVQDLYDEKMQEGKHGHYETMFYVVHQAIKKVAPPKQQAEPCIGKDPRCPCQDGDACHYKDCGNTKARLVAQPEQEPVAWAVQGCSKMWRDEFAEIDAKAEAKRIGGTCVAYALYTTPPAAQRKPLTEEEISNIWDDTVTATVIPFFMGFARGVEAAHNIKE